MDLYFKRVKKTMNNIWLRPGSVNMDINQDLI